MINMKLLAVPTPLYINLGCSTWKTFWEQHFTGEEKFTLGEFSAVNMKNCGRSNIRKHRVIKGSDKYVTLNILLKFDSLKKMIIKSSESNDKLGISVKGLITPLCIKAKTSPNKYKNTRYAIVNVSKKDISNLKVMRRRGPNMSILKVALTYQDSLLSV